MLGADLVGFHTHDYAQHFLKSVRRILGYDHEMGRVMLPDRLSRADTFPMGIEFEAFSARGAEPEVIGTRDALRGTIGGRKAILSIDRLDYSKGIANRLLAYRAFLEANPQWRGRVVLLMVVVPSRTGVEDYQRMKSRIDELVGEVNGTFGSLSWTPVLYQYKSFPQEELLPLYGVSDVMLVTPLRDGMNLMAKEYVAARADGQGVLVLSEMTGAASELGEAVLVNPNDIPEMACALATAMEMPAEEQARRMTAMRDRLRRYDVVRWAGDFLEALGEDRSRLDRRMLSPGMRERIVREFQSAGRRLLLLDYDGTLVPIRPTPEQAGPGPGLLAMLGRLAGIGDVVIVSGRPRATLDAWLGTARRGAGGRARGLGPRAGRGLGRDGGPLRRLEARGPRPDGAVRRPTARGAGRGEGVRAGLALSPGRARPGGAASAGAERPPDRPDRDERAAGRAGAQGRGGPAGRDEQGDGLPGVPVPGLRLRAGRGRRRHGRGPLPGPAAIGLLHPRRPDPVLRPLQRRGPGRGPRPGRVPGRHPTRPRLMKLPTGASCAPLAARPERRTSPVASPVGHPTPNPTAIVQGPSA